MEKKPIITTADVAKLVSDIHDKSIADMRSADHRLAQSAQKDFALSTALMVLLRGADIDASASVNDISVVAAAAMEAGDPIHASLAVAKKSKK